MNLKVCNLFIFYHGILQKKILNCYMKLERKEQMNLGIQNCLSYFYFFIYFTISLI
jgi:hypothetical protein